MDQVRVTIGDVEQELRKRFKVVKSLTAIRAKNGLKQEEVASRVIAYIEARDGESFKHAMASTNVSMTEMEVVASFWLTNKVGVMTVGGRGGLPSLYVGVESQEEWLKLRSWLRENGLVR